MTLSLIILRLRVLRSQYLMQENRPPRRFKFDRRENTLHDNSFEIIPGCMFTKSLFAHG